MPDSALRVLVVEDVESMLGLLEHLLADLPVTVGGVARCIKIVGLAKNTTEARLILTRHRPDLVFLDEVLPGESSVDLLLDLHSQSIPTLLITSMEEATHDLPVEAKGRIDKPGWKSIDRDRARFRAEIERVFGA